MIGLDPGDEGREDERGRFLGGGVGLVTASWGLGLVTAKTACCNSFAHFQRSVSGSAGGRLEVAFFVLNGVFRVASLMELAIPTVYSIM